MSHAALQFQLRSLVGSRTDDGVIALQCSANGSLEMAQNDDEQHQKMGPSGEIQLGSTTPPNR